MTDHKSNRLYAIPRTPEVRLEIAKAIRELAGQCLVTKAGADDPEHPGWPAGSPGGLGGKFRPKDEMRAIPMPNKSPAVQRNLRPAVLARLDASIFGTRSSSDFSPQGAIRNQFDFYKCLNECLGRNR